MKRRAIEPGEQALWHEAMRGVTRDRPVKQAIAAANAETSPVVPAKAGTHGERRAVAVAPSPGLTGGFHRDDGKRETLHDPTPGLDRRQALRLKRGQLEIEARLDLHGMIQTEAHRELAGFIARSYASGKRTLLVVTGKGTREGTGVLRAAVPRWLTEPALRERVLASAPAQPRDGGGGALYILLRRAR
jgi:DNA-nicking Smr family endonuclease